MPKSRKLRLRSQSDVFFIILMTLSDLEILRGMNETLDTKLEGKPKFPGHGVCTDRCALTWNNLQRAVNRQPWLPRGRLVETRATQHDRLHDDLNQHEEVIQHPASQTVSHSTIRVRQLRRRTIYFRCSTWRRCHTKLDMRDSSAMFDFRKLSTITTTSDSSQHVR